MKCLADSAGTSLGSQLHVSHCISTNCPDANHSSAFKRVPANIGIQKVVKFTWPPPPAMYAGFPQSATRPHIIRLRLGKLRKSDSAGDSFTPQIVPMQPAG
jgi:hypothetical protein